MNKQGKVILIIVIIAVVSFAIWQYIKYKNNKKTESVDVTGATVPPSSTSAGTAPAADSFPLKVGSTGGRVSNLQRALNKLVTYYGLSTTNVLAIDGVFGPKTLSLLNPVKTVVGLPANSEVSEFEYNKFILPNI